MELDNGTTLEVEAPIIEDVPKSMDDTIRDTLRNITKETPETTLETKVETNLESKPEEIQAEPEVPLKKAPTSWKKEAAEKFNTLPPEVQAEIERREGDIFKGIDQYKQKAQFGAAIETAIAPYAQTLQALNVTPDKAIAELMAADHKLRYGAPHEKQAYFAQLAQSYGIDLGAVQNPEMNQVDPNVLHLQTQLQQLQGYIQNQQQTEQQRASQSLNSEIEQFSSDPNHKHFENVRGHMSALLQAGHAQTLQDAYEQAIYANPQTRALVLAEQQAAAKAEIAKKAQAAKTAASVNVRSRSALPSSQPIGTMDDTIRATLRRIQGA
jgi:hypothetical protein